MSTHATVYIQTVDVGCRLLKYFATGCQFWLLPVNMQRQSFVPG
jgi:hypothetical protein